MGIDRKRGRARYQTLKQIDAQGCDIRVWCFRCARGATFDGVVADWLEKRGKAGDLADAAVSFPCKLCRQSDCVAILPARRPKSATTATQLVAAWFHGMRSAGNKGPSKPTSPRPIAEHHLE